MSLSIFDVRNVGRASLSFLVIGALLITLFCSRAVAITALLVPAAPSNLVFYTNPTPTSGEIDWLDNSTNENSFTIERKVDGQPDSAFLAVGSVFATNVQGTGDTVYYTDNNLQSDTVYDYRVKAIAIDGTPSAYSNSATLTTAPTAPQIGAAAAVAGTDNSVKVNWTDTAAHTTYFQIFRSSDGATYNYVANSYQSGFAGTVGSGNTLSFTDTGLNSSATYYYEIAAVNSAGASAKSAAASATTNATDTVPIAPYVSGGIGYSGPSGNADPGTTAGIYVTDQSTNETGFTLERQSSDGNNLAYVPLTTYPSAFGTGKQYGPYYDIGLAADSEYKYKAFASNGIGVSSDSNVITVDTTPAAPAIGVVTAVPQTDNSLKVTWTDEAKHAQYFQIYRSLDGNTYAYVSNSYQSGNTGTAGKGNSLSFTDTGLNASTTYYYEITAVNSAGASARSGAANGTTNATLTVPIAPSVSGGIGYSGADGKADPGTTAGLYTTDQSTNETGFTLERENVDDVAPTYVPLTTYPSAVGTGTQYGPYYDIGLSPDSEYKYKAFASNGSGNSLDSNVITVTTTPATPTIGTVTAVPQTDNSLKVTWTDNARYTQYFQIFRSKDGITYSYVANSYQSGNTGMVGKGNTLAYTDTGLNSGTTFYYEVAAVNAAGASGRSSAASGTTNATDTVPIAPYVSGGIGYSGPSGNADPGTTAGIYVTDQSTNETGFTLERENADSPTPSYSSLTTYPGAIGTGTQFGPYYDIGLLPDSEYKYKAFASNGLGNSLDSNVITVDTRPAAPIIQSATALDSATIRVDWTDTARHSSYFQIFRSIDGTTYSYVANSYQGGFAGTVGTGNTETYTDSGLTVNTKYYYEITAVNGAGASAKSAPASATTFPNTAPSEPSDLQASATTGPIQSDLNWLDNSNDEFGFVVERINNDDASSVYTPIPGTNPGDPTVGPQPGTGERVYYVDKGVTSDTSYSYRVKAINPAGSSGYTNTAAVTTAPTAPSNLSGSAVSGHSDQISLSWTDNAKHESGFSVYRKGPNETSFTVVASVASSPGTGLAVNYTDTGLTVNAAYQYYVVAVNAGGVSGPTNTVTVSTSQADTVPPTTSLLTGPAQGSTICDTTVVFTYSGLDNVTPVSLLRFETQWDGGAWSAASLSTSVTIVGLAQGSHTFGVRAVDQAGNVDPNPPTRTFSVDANAPVISSVSVSAIGQTTATINWTTDKPGSTQVQYRVQGTSAWTTSPLVSTLVTAHSVVLTGLISGATYEYVVVSMDMCGDTGTSPISTFRAANPVPPSIVLTSPSDGTSAYAPGSVTVSANATDADGTVTQVEFFQNSVSIGVIKNTPYTVSVAGLAPGTYVFKAVATDDQGANTTSSTATFTVNELPIGVTILSGPADNGIVCSGDVTFSWGGHSATTADNALTYQWQLDSGGWSIATSETQKSFTGLAQGLHTFEVRALNTDSTVVGSPVGRSFFVDLLPPSLLQTQVDTRDVRATISWSTNKPTTGYIEYGTTAGYGQQTTPDTNPNGAHSTEILALATQTTYHYRLHFSDGCHDAVSQDYSFTTSALLSPNLQISAVTVPGSFAPLDKINLSWQVLNAGPGDADNNWTDSVYLSATNVLDVTATKLGDFASVNPLLAFATYTQNQSVAVPRVPAGNYYIIIQTDSTNVVPETNETDNTVAVPVTVTALQDMVVSPDQVQVTLHTTQLLAGQLNLTDLSLNAQTNITASVHGAPSNVTITVTPPTSLQSLQTGIVNYTVVASDASTLQASPTIVLTSASGATAVTTLNITVIPPAPHLVVVPGSLITSMVRGGQRLEDFAVTNEGDATAKGLQLALPNVPWMTLPSANAAGDLLPGATANLELSLQPDQTLPLGQYTGSIALEGSNAGVSIPFVFNCISISTGTLKVVAQDEFSFFADTHPNIAGAHVVLTDATTGTVVVDDVTGADGTLTVPGVTESNYNVDVTADGHTPYHGTLKFIAGETNEIDPFLSRQLVTYTWEVVPIPFTDQYTVQLEAVFETHVPAPVITVDPIALDLSTVTFDKTGTAVVNYTVTNHGLIAANDTTFNFGTNPDLKVTPAVTNLGTVAPLSSVVVPVTIVKVGALAPMARRRSHIAPGGNAGFCGGAVAGAANWVYACGGPKQGAAAFTISIAGNGDCLLIQIGDLFSGGFNTNGAGGGTLGGGEGSFGLGVNLGPPGVGGPPSFDTTGLCAPAP